MAVIHGAVVSTGDGAPCRVSVQQLLHILDLGESDGAGIHVPAHFHAEDPFEGSTVVDGKVLVKVLHHLILDLIEAQHLHLIARVDLLRPGIHCSCKHGEEDGYQMVDFLEDTFGKSGEAGAEDHSAW